MKIIRQREVIFEKSYYLYFELKAGSGFSFPCNEKGVVDESKLHPIALDSYRQCQSGTISRLNKPYKFRQIPGSIPDPEDSYANMEPSPGPWQQINCSVKGVIQESINRQVLPAVGECDGCFAEVELHGFTNTCECGLDYNQSGQQLAPREQWGSETGESLSDILRIK